MLTLLSGAVLFAAAGVGPNGSCLKSDEVEGVMRPWYLNGEPIRFEKKTYVKYGLPRDIPLSEVEWIGDEEGVPVTAEKGARHHEVIYLLHTKGGGNCLLQPYQVEPD